MGSESRVWSLVGALLLTASCGSSTKTEIPKMAINTENARLSGYLEGIQDESCSPLCTKVSRDVEVDETAVLDEALLIEAAENTCFDVTIRTTVGFDRSINQLGATCRLDDKVQPAQVLSETFSVYAYGNLNAVAESTGGGASNFTVLTADMTQADLNTAAGKQISAAEYYGVTSEYTADQLRVIIRKSRICCAGTGNSTIELALSNGVDSGNEGEDLAQAVDFVWLLTE